MNVRQSHAALDMASRELKARKIEVLLGLDHGTNEVQLLEVGCGSGGISYYFGKHSSGRFQVHAVDVKDSRVESAGYAFQTITATGLPYPDAHFDAVISNHVIEHVGDEAAQMHHLQELRRVLKPNGVRYLAVPNRWMLIEPHYSLAFLSWLPVSMRSGYLRRMRGVSFYDCKPLEMGELECMLGASGLLFSNLGVRAVRTMLDIEGKQGLLRHMIVLLPDSIIAWMNPINPTLIYRIART
jgi:SAM-dependent methyltransferase